MSYSSWWNFSRTKTTPDSTPKDNTVTKENEENNVDPMSDKSDDEESVLTEIERQVNQDPNRPSAAAPAVPKSPVSGLEIGGHNCEYVYGEHSPIPFRRACWGVWGECDVSALVVRGPNYMTDGKKIPASRPMLRPALCEIFYTNSKLYDIASRPDNFAYQWFERTWKDKVAANGGKLPKEAKLSPLILFNFLFPADKGLCNLVCYFTRRPPKKHLPASSPKPEEAESTTTTTESTSDNQSESDPIETTTEKTEESSKTEEKKSEETKPEEKKPEIANGEKLYTKDEHADAREAAFDIILEKFMNADDDFRNKRFKLIPRVAEGSWLVRKVVGGKPGLIAQKIVCKYIYNEERNYIEVDVDIHTSKFAGRILSLVKGYATTLVTDLAFVMQGEADDELPEALIGGVRISRPDLNLVQTQYTS